MSNRGRIPPIPSDPTQAFELIAEILTGLVERLERLESAAGTRLPADYRFDEAGGQVIVERVSTGNTATITPPL